MPKNKTEPIIVVLEPTANVTNAKVISIGPKIMKGRLFPILSDRYPKKGMKDIDAKLGKPAKKLA
jgi:hypothetical protein